MKPFKDTYVMYQLLEFIDENGIICLCKASKKLNEICEQYIELEDDKRFEIIGYGYNSNTELLEEYCIKNDIIKVRKLIKMNIDLNWDWGLLGACRGGNIDIINLIIEKGSNNWHYGLEGACKGGHLDIVKLMIEEGADHWNCGLAYACTGGNIDIVKLMIEKGANNWDRGLVIACIRGHIDIIKLMIKKGAIWCSYCGKSMKEHLSDKK